MDRSREIKVLGYSDLSKLEKMMSGHFPSQLKEVSDEVTDKPRTIRELNYYVKEGGFTHVFVLDEHFHSLEGSLKDCSVPVVELLGDHWVYWTEDKKKKYISDNGINNVFVFTDRFLGSYDGVAKFHPVFTGYDSGTFRDEGGERDIDLLISGAMGDVNISRETDPNQWIYPIRNWLADVLPRIASQEGLNLEVLKHPGYLSGKGFDHQREYSRILNRTKIAAGGSSYWKLILKKLYEIPASGSILLSDIPVDDRDFFRGRILEVNPEKIGSKGYEDYVRRMVMNTLENYDQSRQELQPFRSETDRFERSYAGRALEMRRILEGIK